METEQATTDKAGAVERLDWARVPMETLRELALLVLANSEGVRGGVCEVRKEGSDEVVRGGFIKLLVFSCGVWFTCVDVKDVGV